MSNVTTETPTKANLAGKYLTFMLGHEFYGIDVLKIREIIRQSEITVVPQMPEYVRGVINLRGKIIPVLDLRLKFGLVQAETTERTCIVVVQVQSASANRVLMGLVVDDVEEVLHIGAADIEDTPDFGTQLDTAYLLGMAKIKARVVALLDVDPAVGAANIAAANLLVAA